MRRSKELAESGLKYLSRVRLRALLWTLAIVGMTFAALALMSVSWVPVVGVATAALVVSIHKVTQSLRSPVCWECGRDISKEPTHAYGIRCPKCGTLNQPIRVLPDAETMAQAEGDEAPVDSDELPPQAKV